MTDILDGRLVIASVSGGKDSTAMCLHLKERGIPYRAVYMDTGWENAETYRYIEEELPGYIGPITTLRSVVELPPRCRGARPGLRGSHGPPIAHGQVVPQKGHVPECEDPLVYPGTEGSPDGCLH